MSGITLTTLQPNDDQEQNKLMLVRVTLCAGTIATAKV